MFYVYALYNKLCNKQYIGQTSDVQKRLLSHNNKEYPKSYTARFDGTWELVYTEACEEKSQAMVREKQLKSYQGRQFIKKLIFNPR